MVERYLRQGPLAHLHLAGRGAGPEDAGVVLGEGASRGQIGLRGDAARKGFREATREVLGLTLPRTPNTAAGKGATGALWLGPDEWLVLTAAGSEARIAGDLRRVLARRHAAVTELGEGRAVIGLSGPAAGEVLMKGCALDLHPRSFGAGRCAQTLIAKAGVILHRTAEAPAYDIYVARSFAEYLWAWLEDAAAEYGVGTVGIR